ncbi:MAG: Mur ligase family protein [bacterium]
MNTGFETRRMKFGLSRIRAALKKEGFKGKFRSVLIAGSSGKSQTAVFLEQFFIREGLSVGSYISPHLYGIGERVRIMGKCISGSAYYREMAGFGKYRLTYFEKLTAAAFMIFEKKKIDMAVVECGLGGRLDATNILKNEVSVITNVTREHTEYLGDTVEKIAREKAGIIKRNNKVVTLAREPAFTRIRAAAAKKGAQVIRPKVRRNVPYRTEFLKENFSLAKAAFRACGFNADNFEPSVFLPARFEVHNFKGKKIIINGGHTIDACSEALKEILKFEEPRSCVFYSLRDKKIEEMLGMMNGTFQKIFCGSFPHERKMSRSEFNKRIPAGMAGSVFVSGSVKESFSRALAEKSRTILCFGSLLGSAYLKKNFGFLR